MPAAAARKGFAPSKNGRVQFQKRRLEIKQRFERAPGVRSKGLIVGGNLVQRKRIRRDQRAAGASMVNRSQVRLGHPSLLTLVEYQHVFGWPFPTSHRDFPAQEIGRDQSRVKNNHAIGFKLKSVKEEAAA